MRAGSARPSRTNHARSPGRSGRLTARPIQPLTGRQRTRIRGSIRSSTDRPADVSATGPADGRGITDAAITDRTSQADKALLHHRYLKRDIQVSTTSATGLVRVVTL